MFYLNIVNRARILPHKIHMAHTLKKVGLIWSPTLIGHMCFSGWLEIWEHITLFRFIIVFYGTHNIPQNIPYI